MIKKFVGKDIHGYINVDINFNEKVTFLIGVNGSGKTTILRLIRALLCGQVSELLKIDFLHLEVVFTETNNTKECSIVCDKTVDDINFVFKEGSNYIIEEKYLFPDFYKSAIIRKSEQATLSNMREKIEDSIRELTIFQRISSIKQPLVMGLDRRVTEIDREIAPVRARYYSSRETIEKFNYLDRALVIVEEIVHSQTRLRAKRFEEISSEFKTKVAEVVFESKPLTSTNIDINEIVDKYKDLNLFKSQILEATKTLKLKVDTNNIDAIFDNITQSFKIATEAESSPNDRMNAIINWLMLQNQLKSFNKIINLSNDYNKEIEKLNRRLNRMLSSLNLFLKEGGKQLVIDSVGDMYIDFFPKRNNVKNRKIYEASSGEKQIIIMLGYLAFLDAAKNMNTFIIDEPELSLHIAWQEIFVDALIESNPDTQFIIATHSPNIISKLERRDWCVNLSQNNQ